jgi:cell division protein FtsB
MMEIVSMILMLAVGLPVAGTVLIVAMALNYSAKKKGLTRGASQREVEQIRQDIAAIRREIERLREGQADMTLMLHDAAERPLPRPGSRSSAT